MTKTLLTLHVLQLMYFIYLLTYKTFQMQYVGKTVQALQKCIYENDKNADLFF